MYTNKHKAHNANKAIIERAKLIAYYLNEASKIETILKNL